MSSRAGDVDRSVGDGATNGSTDCLFFVCPMNLQGISLRVRYQTSVHGQLAFGGLFSLELIRKYPMVQGPKGRDTMDWTRQRLPKELQDFGAVGGLARSRASSKSLQSTREIHLFNYP